MQPRGEGKYRVEVDISNSIATLLGEQGLTYFIWLDMSNSEWPTRSSDLSSQGDRGRMTLSVQSECFKVSPCTVVTLCLVLVKVFVK